MSLIGLLTECWGGTLSRSIGNSKAASLKGLHSSWMRIPCGLQSPLSSPLHPEYSNPSLRSPRPREIRAELCTTSWVEWQMLYSGWPTVALPLVLFFLMCITLLGTEQPFLSFRYSSGRPCLVSKIKQDQVLLGWCGLGWEIFSVLPYKEHSWDLSWKSWSC